MASLSKVDLPPAAPTKNKKTTAVESGKKAQHKGRSFWDITKLVAKIVAGVALFCLGVLSIAALVTGILLIINPTGFGIGNILGAFLADASLKFGLLITNAFALLSGHAVALTVASAAMLAVTVVAAAVLTIITVSVGKKKDQENHQEGVKNGEKKPKTEEVILDDESNLEPTDSAETR